MARRDGETAAHRLAVPYLLESRDVPPLKKRGRPPGSNPLRSSEPHLEAFPRQPPEHVLSPGEEDFFDQFAVDHPVRPESATKDRPPVREHNVEYVPLLYPEKLYPTTYARFFQRYDPNRGKAGDSLVTAPAGAGITMGANNAPVIRKAYTTNKELPSVRIAPVVARMLRDIELMSVHTRDALHLATLAKMTGIEEDVILKVLNAFFSDEFNAVRVLSNDEYNAAREQAEYEWMWSGYGVPGHKIKSVTAEVYEKALLIGLEEWDGGDDEEDDPDLLEF